MKSVVLMCALVVAASSFAHASHYRLPLPQLIEADETEILKRVGIKTTLALLDRVAKRAGRLRLAKVTKLPLERTTNFYFYAQVVHEFWICEDKGDDLLCVASCGSRDLECPTSVYNANGMSSNTQ